MYRRGCVGKERKARKSRGGQPSLLGYYRRRGLRKTKKKKMRELEEVPEKTKVPPSSHFVLIHGFGHGAWCWYKVRCLLENSGQKVTCLDLKGSGVDPTDASTIDSFDEYNKPLLDFMDALPAAQKVILVGHSSGGMNVTQAIHGYPHKIQGSVFLAATMLRFGFQSEQDIKDGAPNLSEYGEVNEYEYTHGIDQPPTTAIMKKDILRKILYPMCPLEDSTLAAMLLRPGPLLAIQGAKFEGPEQPTTSGVPPHFYIKTLQDRVLKVEQQEAMINRWKPSKVYEMDTDHSPFFSNPFLLSGLLLDISLTYQYCI